MPHPSSTRVRPGLAPREHRATRLVALSFDSAASPKFTLGGFDKCADGRAYGWGFAWYPEQSGAALVIKDATSLGDNAMTKLLREWERFESTTFIAHVRGAARALQEQDTHPFARAHGGRDWVIAHNGDLDPPEGQTLAEALPLGEQPVHEPIGRTDSERAFCWVLTRARDVGARTLADIGWPRLHEWLRELDGLGTANFMLSDGRDLVAYCDDEGYNPIHFGRFVPPHVPKALKTNEISVGLEDARDRTRTVAVFSTEPFAKDGFKAMHPGQLVAVRRGAVVHDSHADEAARKVMVPPLAPTADLEPSSATHQRPAAEQLQAHAADADRALGNLFGPANHPSVLHEEGVPENGGPQEGARAPLTANGGPAAPTLVDSGVSEAAAQPALTPQPTQPTQPGPMPPTSAPQEGLPTGDPEAPSASAAPLEAHPPGTDPTPREASSGSAPDLLSESSAPPSLEGPPAQGPSAEGPSAEGPPAEGPPAEGRPRPQERLSRKVRPPLDHYHERLARGRLLSVDHHTTYRYSTPVEKSFHLFRLEPIHDRWQDLLEHEIEVSVDGLLRHYEDVFGNTVIRADIERPFTELVVRARSLVRVRSDVPDDLHSPHRRFNIPLVWMPWQRQMMTPYLLPPELPETQLRELSDFAMSFVERQDFDLVQTLLDMNITIYRDFSYTSGSTTFATTPFDVFTQRRGVCQDFANLLICLARLLNIPARYRVGYIYTGGNYENEVQSDASHAWAELYLPWTGWQGFDPTNGCLVNRDHIRVACGRNYGDATPTSGTLYKGGGEESLTVEVKVEEALIDGEEAPRGS